MSPVFGHGRLRLYLLKLLGDRPRHGYEVIRLLQDRFLGVYAPSPGTIYPRLARLEEEGLITHEVAAGRKVYRLTEAGKAELSDRRSELADLEAEITASVRDIAREVKADVRETVRSLRDELTAAARELRHNRSRGRTDRDRPAHDGSPWRGGSETRLHAELDHVLRDFAASVRRLADDAELDGDALARVRTVLDDTVRRLTDEIGSGRS